MAQSPAPPGPTTVTGRGHDPLRPDGYKIDKVQILSATVAVSIVSLALPVFTLQVYDRILPNPGNGTLTVLLVGVIIAILLEAILRLARAYIVTRNGASYEHRMACIAMDKVLNAHLDREAARGIGGTLNQMTSVSRLKDFYSGYSLTVVAELAFVPVFLGVIAYLNLAMALVVGAVLCAFTAVSLIAGMRLRRAINDRHAADDVRFDFLIEALEGIHTIKAFALEPSFERRYEAFETRSTESNFHLTRHMGALFNLGAMASNVMVAAVIGFGAVAVLGGELTAGALVATLVLSARSIQPMQRGLSLWARYQDYQVARGHLRQICELPDYGSRVGATSPPSERRTGRDGAVAIHDLRLDQSGVCLFAGINLTLQRGDSVLVTGGSDARTAFVDLIAGLYTPTGGTIAVDGLALDAFDKLDLTRHVGHVRADAPIFRGTIRDNITAFGQHDVVLAREVAALLGIDKDVAALPAGFDTALTGTATDTLPPGLTQRIAIARALAPKPRIILFDNADRALDRQGYAQVYSILARLKGRATMILVSDDKNIKALADRVLNLADGTVHERVSAPHEPPLRLTRR